MSQKFSTITAPVPKGDLARAGAPAGAVLDRHPLEGLRPFSQHEKLRRRQKPSGLNAEDSVLIVRSGLVVTEASMNAQTPIIMDVCYPGDVIATVPGQSVSGFAATAAEVWRIRIQDLAQAEARDAALAAYLIKAMRGQTARAHLRSAVISGLSSGERVAALLMEGALRLGVKTDRGPSFELPLSRVQIANMLSLNADTLSRIMSRLTSEGVIARASRALVTITDWDRLVAMCPLRETIYEHAAA